MKQKIIGVSDTKYITLKKDDLERRFREYNEKYFGGVLPPCRVIIKTDKDHNVPALYLLKNPTIYFARNVYWTEDFLKSVFIHEMVHHYVKTILNYVPNFFHHGRRYRKVCRMLRKKHGLRVNLYELPLEHWKGEKKPTILKELLIRFLSWILPL